MNGTMAGGVLCFVVRLFSSGSLSEEIETHPVGSEWGFPLHICYSWHTMLLYSWAPVSRMSADCANIYIHVHGWGKYPEPRAEIRITTQLDLNTWAQIYIQIGTVTSEPSRTPVLPLTCCPPWRHECLIYKNLNNSKKCKPRYCPPRVKTVDDGCSSHV